MELELLTGERQSKESNNAVIACNDYLRMGPGRSLDKLHARYRSVTNPLPPTKRITTLKNWSRWFGWVNRAGEYDAGWEERKDKERYRVFNSELALDFERVRKLNALGKFLEEQLFEQGVNGQYHNIWLPDVKVVGSGEFAEAIDIERFNAAIIKEYRETLNDLAAETGGRVKKQDITIEDWRTEVVDKLKSGELTTEEVKAVWPDLAHEFFAKAGVSASSDS